MPELKLKATLKKRKVSKRKLAKLMGVPTYAVFRYFRPEFNPTFRLLCRIAAALRCKVKDLIKE